MFDQLHISHAHLIQLEINCKQHSIDILGGGHNNNVFLRTAATTFPIHNKTATFCFQVEKSMFFSFAAGPTDRRARVGQRPPKGAAQTRPKCNHVQRLSNKANPMQATWFNHVQRLWQHLVVLGSSFHRLPFVVPHSKLL